MVNERLRRARTLRGEELAVVAARIGVRVGVLRAIEDGRFDLLPPGIYARAAIRSYSSAVGLDPLEILDEIAPSLPAVAEPISAIGRLRGVKTTAPERTPPDRPSPDRPSADQSADHAVQAVPAVTPNWRLLMASFVDACIVGILLSIVVGCARIATEMPLSVMGPSGSGALATMGVVFAGAYYLWFGGLMAATAGEWSVGLGEAEHPSAGHTTLARLGARAFRCATADVRFIADTGVWLRALVRVPGRRSTQDAGSGLRLDSNTETGLQVDERQAPDLRLIRGVMATSGGGRPAEPVEDIDDIDDIDDIEDDDLTIRMSGPPRDLDLDPDLTLD